MDNKTSFVKASPPPAGIGLACGPRRLTPPPGPAFNAKGPALAAGQGSSGAPGSGQIDPRARAAPPASRDHLDRSGTCTSEGRAGALSVPKLLKRASALADVAVLVSGAILL